MRTIYVNQSLADCLTSAVESMGEHIRSIMKELDEETVAAKVKELCLASVQTLEMHKLYLEAIVKEFNSSKN